LRPAIRTGTVWPEVFPRFLDARAFDDSALVLMLKSFVDHAEYLTKFHTGGNWLTMEANGLYHIGAMFRNSRIPNFGAIRPSRGWITNWTSNFIPTEPNSNWPFVSRGGAGKFYRARKPDFNDRF